MAQADTIVGGQEIKSIEGNFALTVAEREALVIAILKSEKALALERLIDAEIRRIESISGIDNVEKARMIDRLRGVKGSADVGRVMQALSEVRIREVQEEAEAAVSKAVSYESVLQEIAEERDYNFDRTEMRRIIQRSRAIDPNNAESVREFSDAVLDADVPKEIRSAVVEDTVRLMKSEPMKEAVNTYNAASERSRVEVNAEHEHAKKNLKKAVDKAAKHSDPEIKKEFERTSDTGAAAHPEIQKIVKQVAEGKLDVEKAKEPVKKLNDEWLKRVKLNIPDALEIVPKQISDKAKELGGPDEIAQAALRAFHAQKASPTRVPTQQEAAAQRVFFQARTAEIFRQLGNDAIAKDIQRGATLEQREEQAIKLLREKSPDVVKNIPDEVLKRTIHATLIEADKRHIPLSMLDEIKGKELQEFSNQVFSDVLGKKLLTGAKTFAEGAVAMLTGDERGAEKAATAAGRGVVRTLRAAGVSNETAQEIGAEAAQRLRATGAAVAGAVSSVQSSLAKVQLKFGLDGDVAKQLEALKKSGWVDLRVGDKKLFDANGDGKLSVDEIKAVLEKSGVNLASFDKDNSGNLSGKELTDAMKAAYDVQVAQLKPTDTPRTTAATTQVTKPGRA